MSHDKKRFAEGRGLKGSDVFAGVVHESAPRSDEFEAAAVQPVVVAEEVSKDAPDYDGHGHSSWRFTESEPPEDFAL